MINKKDVTPFFIVGYLLVGGFLITASQVEATSSSAGVSSVEFATKDEATNPLDPEDPEKELDIDGPILSTEGALRFDYIPTFTFGNQMMTAEDQHYFADAIKLKNSEEQRANYLQITDNRGSSTGWRVTLKQEQEFLSKTSGTPLQGAYLSFDNQWSSSSTEELGSPTISKETIKITDIGSSYPVATAEAGVGSGTWMISFGSSHEQNKMKATLVSRAKDEKELPGTQGTQKNSSIKLFVPGNAEKKQENYFTVLTWTLSEI